jgi:hypothetical protein
MRAVLLLAIFATLTGFAESATDLKLEPLVIRSFDGDQLVVIITNSGADVLLPTQGYALTIDDTDAEATKIELRFRFEELAYDDRKWKVISPRTAFAPVPLRAGESAQIAIRLDSQTALGLELASSSLEVAYVVEPEVAERYSLWRGELTFQKHVKPLRIAESLATTEQSADATSKALAAAELAPDVKLLEIGDDVLARPGLNSAMRGRVAGRFLGVKGGYVRIGPRRILLRDIRPDDREQFELYQRFNP